MSIRYLPAARRARAGFQRRISVVGRSMSHVSSRRDALLSTALCRHGQLRYGRFVGLAARQSLSKRETAVFIGSTIADERSWSGVT